jgi:transposase-like protein
MPKYDVEFKKKCIKSYEEGKPLPNVAGVLPSSMMRFVTEWRLLFKEQGEKGLTNDIIYRNYSLKDKIKAIRRINKGETYSAVSRSIGMRCHSTVRRWHLDYMKHGVAGLQYKKGIKPSTSVVISNPMKKRLTKAEREELNALRKRNEILEIENEYLKKLDALVSKREREEAKAKKQK